MFLAVTLHPMAALVTGVVLLLCAFSDFMSLLTYNQLTLY